MGGLLEGVIGRYYQRICFRGGIVGCVSEGLSECIIRGYVRGCGS